MEAKPSTPVAVLGLNGVPQAGDYFQVVRDETKAKRIGVFRQAQTRQKSLQKPTKITLEQLYSQIEEGTVKELPVILKADVQGSVEVIEKALTDLSTEKVRVSGFAVPIFILRPVAAKPKPPNW